MCVDGIESECIGDIHGEIDFSVTVLAQYL